VSSVIVSVVQKDSSNQKAAQYKEEPNRKKAKRNKVRRKVTIDREKVMDHYGQHRECS
jgi:hypothetical protein